jgi:hypothetical protein
MLLVAQSITVDMIIVQWVSKHCSLFCLTINIILNDKINKKNQLEKTIKKTTD